MTSTCGERGIDTWLQSSSNIAKFVKEAHRLAVQDEDNLIQLN